MKSAAATVMERCEVLGRVSEEPGLLVRSYGTRALGEANEIVAGWMREAGMEVREDSFGNLVGRYEGTGEKTFVLGSHLDTVRDAGKYDGTLGVLVALACVEELHAREERLPFAVEVVAFADEEGLRFGTTFLGSSVYAGILDPTLLTLTDADGTTLAEAVRSFGGDPGALEGGGRSTEDLLGYCEIHIEQGPVLERLDLPVGVVSAISGQIRAVSDFAGEAGHAGTVPMKERRDALCAAAEFVLAVEEVAREEPGAVATVGEVAVLPGANNVIPGRVSLTLDIRHGEDEARERLRDALKARAEEAAHARGCEVHWDVRQEAGAIPVAPRLAGLLGDAVEYVAGTPARWMPSGAGHDAAPLAALTPVALLFVRCKEGISHNPAESIATEDVAVAVEVVDRFLKLVSNEATPGLE